MQQAQKLLEQIKEVLGEIEITVIREVTKKFEELKKDKVSFIIEHFKLGKVRGEFVVIINKQK